MAVINIDDAYILGETGAQVDKVTGLFTKDEDTTSGEKAFAQLNIGTAGSNRNLLDNPWFTVRQRGNGAFSAPNYTADRWKLTAGSAQLSFDDNGGVITPNGSYLLLTQYTRIPSNIGTVTASIKISGTVYSVTGSAATGFQLSLADVWGSGRIEVAASGGYLNFIIGASTAATFEAVKLELGSVSTLANDTPPDFWSEWAKCRRYFKRYKAYSAVLTAIGVCASTTNAQFIFGDEPMAKDSVTATYSGNLTIQLGDGTTHAISAVSASTLIGGGVVVSVTSSGLVAGDSARLRINTTESYLDLSAEL